MAPSTMVFLAGTASDTVDGNLISMIVWESDIDSVLFVGASGTPSLSPGVHTITATVTAPTSGLSSVASIVVEVPAPFTDSGWPTGSAFPDPIGSCDLIPKLHASRPVLKPGSMCLTAIVSRICESNDVNGNNVNMLGVVDFDDVILKFTLPSELTLDAIGPASCSVAGPEATCDIGMVDATPGFQCLEVSASDLTHDLLVEVEIVSSDPVDFDTGNNTASVTLLAPNACPIFGDGFESGSTAGWSNTQP